uniref:nucleoside phosphorylase n=1 Tax=Ndongobacter massiliensis TaxID=1871025 RepID=UPI0009310308|nr:nucleoside phosphorylase [Ndongobacter massiliensis]
MSKSVLLPCIAVEAGDIYPRVLTCGDPKRAERIASRLDNSVCLAKNREFWVFNGEKDGVGISIISHGVGAGGAVIAFESMVRAGAKAIVRLGTCGGMQDNITAGSLVISTGACRDDGMTEKIVPLSFPAVANYRVVQSLIEQAKKKNIPVNVGLTLTQGHFYLGVVESNVKRYASLGVLANDNEMSGLFVVAAMHGILAGGLMVADAKAFELETVESYQPDPAMMQKAVDQATDIVLDALMQLEV